jgi:RsiW-degrading membrane proteinase PrsW (M82 family)
VLSKPVMTAIALVVTLVWLASWVAQFIPALAYKPDPQINLIFGTLIGGLFAVPKLLGKADDKPQEPGAHRKDADEKTGS